jgi:hypothetical protein
VASTLVCSPLGTLARCAWPQMLEVHQELFTLHNSIVESRDPAVAAAWLVPPVGEAGDGGFRDRGAVDVGASVGRSLHPYSLWSQDGGAALATAHPDDGGGPEAPQEGSLGPTTGASVTALPQWPASGSFDRLPPES